VPTIFTGNNVKYKPAPYSSWFDWPYLPPSKGTLEILKREANANYPRQMRQFMADKRKGVKTTVPHKFAMFYGEKVWGFKFTSSNEEWNLG